MRMICTVLALLLCLTGCRAASEQTPDSTAQNTPTNTQPPATTQNTPPSTQAPTTAPVAKEQILAENEQVLVKLTGIEEDPIWGYTLKVYLENRTDKKLMFTVEDTAVNGFMCDPFWASEVSAGMKANETISFFESDFEANGIEKVTDIVFTLRVYDSDDWSSDDYVNQKVEIRP